LSTGGVFSSVATRIDVGKGYFIAAFSTNYGYDIVIVVEGELKFFAVAVPTVPVSLEMFIYVDDV